MKHFSHLAALLLGSSTLFAQNLPVSQTAENKKVLLEEFTAYKCGNCPAGHEVAAGISQSLGEENVVIVAYHIGSLAAPNAGDPDFRTDDGNTVRNFLGVFATPQGPINRGAFGTNDFVIGANSWTANAATIRTQNAEANVALDVAISSTTREAVIDAEVFYTTSGSENHYITIGYSQNNIVGPQSSYNADWNADEFNADGTYNHKHVFRGFVNSHEGDLTNASSSDVQEFQYSFTVPEDINGVPVNLDELEFFAILHEGENNYDNSNVLNVGKATPQVTVGLNELSSSDFLIHPNPSNGTFQIEDLNKGDIIQAVDLTGKEISIQKNGSQLSINQSGVFLIKIENEKGIRTSRVVIQ